MTRAKKVSGRSLLGWRLKTLQALSICHKSLPTDKPISCYLWKRNIYSEVVRSEVPASPPVRWEARGRFGGGQVFITWEQMLEELTMVTINLLMPLTRNNRHKYLAL